MQTFRTPPSPSATPVRRRQMLRLAVASAAAASGLPLTTMAKRPLTRPATPASPCA